MSNNSFRDYVLEQLAVLSGVRCRAMFRGYGLYCGEQFLGMVHDDRLYFKTHPDALNDYLRYQSDAFAPLENKF